jgi:hypothetical protein
MNSRERARLTPRFRCEGEAGLVDRGSRPWRRPRSMGVQERDQLETLRRQRWPLWRIAAQAGRGMETVSRRMKRLGLWRLSSVEPPVPVVRYERAAPGELLRIRTDERGDTCAHTSCATRWRSTPPWACAWTAS